jgi:hypothetical protein
MDCDHVFVFLRKTQHYPEPQPDGFPSMSKYGCYYFSVDVDVFFCQRCCIEREMVHGKSLEDWKRDWNKVPS